MPKKRSRQRAPKRRGPTAAEKRMMEDFPELFGLDKEEEARGAAYQAAYHARHAPANDVKIHAAYDGFEAILERAHRALDVLDCASVRHYHGLLMPKFSVAMYLLPEPHSADAHKKAVRIHKGTMEFIGRLGGRCL